MVIWLFGKADCGIYNHGDEFSQWLHLPVSITKFSIRSRFSICVILNPTIKFHLDQFTDLSRCFFEIFITVWLAFVLSSSEINQKSDLSEQISELYRLFNINDHLKRLIYSGISWLEINNLWKGLKHIKGEWSQRGQNNCIYIGTVNGLLLTEKVGKPRTIKNPNNYLILID